MLRQSVTIAGDTQTGTKGEVTVFPRPSAKGVGFQIELTDGSIYSVKMSDTLNLNGGYKYTFNITLKKTPTTVSADIQPWGEGAISGLSALAISTPAENSRNITIGDTMRVYADDKYLVTYTYQTDGSWKSSQPVYWENIGVGKLTVPFRAMTILAAPLHSTQMPDLLISTSKENNRNTGVSFELKRVAAKVKVQLASSDHSLSEQELNRAEITLPDYTTGGTIDNGLFQAGAVKATITTDRGEALLQPQTITIGTTAVVVTIDGNTYKGIASTEIKYNAGEITHLNVNIIKTEIQMSAVITPWSDGADMDLTGKLLNVKTSGSTTDFVAGDKIKVEILQNLPKNASYEYNGTAWITNAPLWWDDLIRPTEIAATMPDTAIISNQKTIHWSIPANQNTATGWKNADLLTVYIASLPAGDAANFTFRHAMSRVKVVIQPGTEFTAADLQNRTILLNGMPQSATVNIIDGSSSELSGNQNITPKETSPLNYEALVIPHGAVAVGTEIITLTLGTDTYPVKLTAPLTFVSGQLHTITVKLSKTNITLSATVEPWGNGQGGTIEIK
ncbi:MAG: fimbrillin family protein [Odoribacter sp.]